MDCSLGPQAQGRQRNTVYIPGCWMCAAFCSALIGPCTFSANAPSVHLQSASESCERKKVASFGFHTRESMGYSTSDALKAVSDMTHVSAFTLDTRHNSILGFEIVTLFSMGTFIPQKWWKFRLGVLRVEMLKIVFRGVCIFYTHMCWSENA